MRIDEFVQRLEQETSYKNVYTECFYEHYKAYSNDNLPILEIKKLELSGGFRLDAGELELTFGVEGWDARCTSPCVQDINFIIEEELDARYVITRASTPLIPNDMFSFGVMMKLIGVT